MMTEPTRELTPLERKRGLRLMRRCDAYTLMECVLDDAAKRGDIPDTEALENARAELRARYGEVREAFVQFKREHGLPVY
jgi:hypothetical protein